MKESRKDQRFSFTWVDQWLEIIWLIFVIVFVLGIAGFMVAMLWHLFKMI